jgi:beta propeller repeat protein
MKIMKAKSIFGLILFSILTLGLASIATSAVTRITINSFEDSFPKTAGGYVVWQGHDGNDWEIFLYNANDGSGPFQITDNTYNDINPETDGKYVTWAAGTTPLGEIFLYDIATSTTTQLTNNAQLDHYPKIVDDMVVWVSHSVGVDTLFGPGDIVLYDIAGEAFYNISALVEPSNIYDDFAFRFDGNRIVWGHEDDDLGAVVYVCDLATGSIYRYIDPEDDEEIPYLEDLVTGETYPKPEGLALQDVQQIEGDFLVFTRKIGGSDREIMIRDLQVERGGQITANSIEDTQPAIKDNIVVWKGDEGNNSEIYLYEIQPLFADADYDFEMDIASVNQMVIRGKAVRPANADPGSY